MRRFASSTALPFTLRSVLRCDSCGLRMQGRRWQSGNYYVCEARRRPELMPEGHPQTVFLTEARPMDRVLHFLQTRVFGPERAALLAEALQGDGAVDTHGEELGRLERELEELNVRVRRQVVNLESEEPGSELAREIRRRVETLLGLRSKKQTELEAAQRRAPEHPPPETAQALLEALPSSTSTGRFFGTASSGTSWRRWPSRHASTQRRES